MITPLRHYSLTIEGSQNWNVEPDDEGRLAI